MMWPRLQLLKQLLADDGIIFVSIDDNEQHHLRMLMDDVFGEENFFAVLTRRSMHTVRNSSKDFNLNADYVLVYGRYKAWFSEEPSRYIRYVTDKSASYPSDDNDGRGRFKLDPISARNYYTPYTFTFTNGVKWAAPAGSYPRYSEETLRLMESEGRIDFAGKEPRAKRYLAEVQEGQPPDAYLSPDLVGFNADGTRELREIFGEGGVFSQPKPTKLIKHLMGLLRSPDAIILDSFAGSGTTAHAVLALNQKDGGNRKFILVECEDYADTITAERVRRVINGVPSAKDSALQKGLGGTFTYCTLGDPIDAEGLLTGEAMPTFATLAAYLLHTAKAISVGDGRLERLNDDGLFYSTAATDYYLFYEPDTDWLLTREAMLTEERADRISAIGKHAVVFGPGKYMGQRELTDKRITFCQLPYDMHRPAVVAQ